MSKPKILVILREGYGGLFMLNEQHEGRREEPVNENENPDLIYQEALARVERRKAMGFDVALDVKSRLFG